MSKFFSLIFSGEIHRAEDDKVLPEDQFSVLLDAKEVLSKAKEDVKTYLKQKGTFFVVIGSGHYLGDRGIIALLKKDKIASEQL